MSHLELPTVEPLPLRVEADGTVRVGASRVTLDTMVATFNEGSTAEAVLLKYPSLNLAEIYAVFSYYLRHRGEVDAYLNERRGEAEEMRRQIEELCPPNGFRERLLSRRAKAT